MWSRKGSLAIAAIAALISFVFFVRRFRVTLRLPIDEQRLSPFSESAFYISFFFDVVDAPSFSAAVDTLLRDGRSEYPDVVNALRRFNVYQEFLTGMLYRCVNLVVPGVLNYFNFYAILVFAFAATGVGAVSYLASTLGKDWRCGVAAFGFFAGLVNQRLILRLSSIPLRENWGTPLLWLNFVATTEILSLSPKKMEKGGGSGWKIMFFLSTLFALLFWQFSSFAFTTQGTALFATYLLGFPVRGRVKSLFILHTAASVTALVLQFFPRLLYMSVYMHMNVAILIVLTVSGSLWARRGTGDGSSEGAGDWPPPSFSLRLSEGISAVLLWGVIRLAFNSYATDDSHVFQILKEKFGFAEHNFDSKIYQMGAIEFDFIQNFQVNMIKESGVHWLALPVLLGCFVHAFVGFGLSLWVRSGPRKEKEEGGSAETGPVDTGGTGGADGLRNRKAKAGGAGSGVKGQYQSQSSGSEKSRWAGEDESDVGIVVDLAYHREGTVASQVASKGKKEKEKDKEKGGGEKKTGAGGWLWGATWREHPQLCYHFLQGAAFVFLAYTISRLRVLALPHLCALGGAAVSPFFWASAVGLRAPFGWGGRRRSRCSFLGWVVLVLLQIGVTALCTLPFWFRVPLSEMKDNPEAENAGFDDVKELCQWMEKNLPKGAGLFSDMTLSAQIRAYSPTFSIVVHPQYEEEKMRKRVQKNYAFAACPPIEEIHEMLHSEFKDVDYVILNIYRCATPNDKSVTTVFDVAAHLDERRWRCDSSISNIQRLCMRIQVDDSHFQMIYRNGRYGVLKRLPDQQTRPKRFKPYGDFKPYDLSLISSWKGWLEECERTDPLCAKHIVAYARSWIDHYSNVQVGKSFYEYALERFDGEDKQAGAELIHHYAEFLDYDANQQREALSWYRRSAATATGDDRWRFRTDLALFLDQVVGRNRRTVEEAKVLIRLTWKDLRDGKTLHPNDVEHVCKMAQLCLAFADDRQLQLSVKERNDLTGLAYDLWKPVRAINLYAKCAQDAWETFEGKKKTEWDRFLDFFGRAR